MYGRRSFSTSTLTTDKENKMRSLNATKRLSLFQRCKQNMLPLKCKVKSLENTSSTKTTSNHYEKSPKPKQIVKGKVYFSKMSNEVNINVHTPEVFKPKVKTYSTYSVKPKTIITCRSSTSNIITSSTPKIRKSTKRNASLRSSKSLNDVQTNKRAKDSVLMGAKSVESNLMAKNPVITSQTFLKDNAMVFSKLSRDFSKTFFINKPPAIVDHRQEACTSEYCSQASLISVKEDSSTQYDLNDIATPKKELKNVHVQCSFRNATVPTSNVKDDVLMMYRRDLEDMFRRMLNQHLEEIMKTRVVNGGCYKCCHGKVCVGCHKRKHKRTPNQEHLSKSQHTSTQTESLLYNTSRSENNSSYQHNSSMDKQVQTSYQSYNSSNNNENYNKSLQNLTRNLTNFSISSKDSIYSYYEYPSLNITLNYDDDYTWEDEFFLIENSNKYSNDDIIQHSRDNNNDDDDDAESYRNNYKEESLINSTDDDSILNDFSLIDNVNQLENYYEKSNCFYRKRIGTYIDGLENIRKDVIDMEKKFAQMKIKFD